MKITDGSELLFQFVSFQPGVIYFCVSIEKNTATFQTKYILFRDGHIERANNYDQLVTKEISSLSDVALWDIWLIKERLRRPFYGNSKIQTER